MLRLCLFAVLAVSLPYAVTPADPIEAPPGTLAAVNVTSSTATPTTPATETTTNKDTSTTPAATTTTEVANITTSLPPTTAKPSSATSLGALSAASLCLLASILVS